MEYLQISRKFAKEAYKLIIDKIKADLISFNRTLTFNELRIVTNTWFTRIFFLKVLDINNINSSYKELNNLNTENISKFLDGLTYISSSLFNSTDFVNSYIPIDNSLLNLINELPVELFNLNNLAENFSMIYEYFNSDFKEQTNKELISRVKINSSTLPTITQIFTPEYIVKYLVQNSIGRLWINHLLSIDSSLNEESLIENFNWNFYIPTKFDINNYPEKSIEYFKKINLENLTVLDPALGLGSILSYSFDLLLQIYSSEGFSLKDAAILILKNNLIGLDIDPNVRNICELILKLKAYQYNEEVFSTNITLNLFSFTNTPKRIDEYFNYLKEYSKDSLNPKTLNELKTLFNSFKTADELGSLIKVNDFNFTKDKELINSINYKDIPVEISTVLKEIQLELNNLLDIAKILSSEFDIVITNPPYLSNRSFNPNIKKYLKKNYKVNSRDLYTAFIDQCLNLTKENGYCSLVTMNSWLFLKYNKPLRERILNNSIISLVHLGTKAFKQIPGEVVQTVAFIIEKLKLSDFKGSYLRLVDIDNKVDGIKEKKNLTYTNSANFKNIPSFPIAYWASDNLIKHFKDDISLEEIADSKQGLATTDNKRFLRQWTELDFKDIKFGLSSTRDAQLSGYKWFPYNKGGSFRKWYGNDQYCVDYYDDGKEIKENVLKKYRYLKTTDFVVKNTNYYFKPSITWSLINTGVPSFRFKEEGFIFDVAGMSVFTENNPYYLLGLLNSVISQKFLEIIAPTINYQCGDIALVPVIVDKKNLDKVEALVKENIEISKSDWDNFEFSWGFKKHPLIRNVKTIKEAFELYENESNERFKILKNNEEELNQLFLKIYGLTGELPYEVNDQYISVNKADLTREIKSLLSYFMGVMFGRYSLKKDGIMATNKIDDFNNFDRITPVKSNFIPIKDKSGPDIIDHLENFLCTVFDSNYLEENLSFIATVLNPKSTKNSREIIRNYFKRWFFKDHKRIYHNRPIYLQLNTSVDEIDGFIYYHRFNESGFEDIKKHLNKAIIEIEEELNNFNEDSSTQYNFHRLNNKHIEALELKEKLDNLMNSEIDLNDGFLNNFKKLQTDFNGKAIKLFKPAR